MSRRFLALRESSIRSDGCFTTDSAELGRGRHLRERRIGRAHPSNAVIHPVVVGHYRSIAEPGCSVRDLPVRKEGI
jgi:hypothetical protein